MGTVFWLFMCPCWFDTSDRSCSFYSAIWSGYAKLINCVDRSLLDDRIAHQSGRLQILMVHVDRGDLAVVVGGVVVDAFVCVAAGGVEGDLILAVFEEAASLLFHGSEVWKNWLTLSSSESPEHGGPDENWKIARKSDGSHTAAVSLVTLWKNDSPGWPGRAAYSC